MKELFDDEDDNENFGLDKAKILVTVIPFVLIILILAITLVVRHLGKDGGRSSDDLQQSIMDYADENRGSDTSEDTASPVRTNTADQADDEDVPADSSSVVNEKGGEEEEELKEDTSGQESAATPTPYKQIMETEKKDYSKVKFNKDEQLKEMIAYWADNNQKALDDLANLDRFIAMSWQLRDTSDFYYYGDTDGSGRPNGRGIAVYADNQYYYGDWKAGVRSGTGTWMHYHIHQTKNTNDLYIYHQYTGSWANDLPDGEGSEHYDYDTSLFKERIGYNTNLIGSYSEGLVDGEFYLTNIYSDESFKEWNAVADHGSWVYQSKNRDKKGNRTVYVDAHNPDNYIWMQPKDNVNIGVPCLISSNKKSIYNGNPGNTQ